MTVYWQLGVLEARVWRTTGAPRGADHATVTVSCEGARLTVTIEDNGTARSAPVVALADRVGALGGSLSIQQAACRAEIPCA
jgi:hypothetical protein